METSAHRNIDAVLKRKTLSQRDFRRLERLGDEGFDYVKELLSRSTSVQYKINGLKLLIHVGNRISQRRGTVRLSEVFDVAADLLGDPDPRPPPIQME